MVFRVEIVLVTEWAPESDAGCDSYYNIYQTSTKVEYSRDSSIH